MWQRTAAGNMAEGVRDVAEGARDVVRHLYGTTLHGLPCWHCTAAAQQLPRDIHSTPVYRHWLDLHRLTACYTRWGFLYTMGLNITYGFGSKSQILLM